MLVVQTVEIIMWVTFRGSFIEVTVPFNMDSYHTTLDTRNRVNARVVYGWTEVTGQPFMRVRQVGRRSASWTDLTTFYTQINMRPWGSFQLFLLSSRIRELPPSRCQVSPTHPPIPTECLIKPGHLSQPVLEIVGS